MIMNAGGMKDELDGHALHDLREVSRRVVGRKQAELEPARRCDAVHRRRQLIARERIHRYLRALTGPHASQLSLHEVGYHVDVVEWNDLHELGARSNVLAYPYGPRTHGAVDRRRDHGVTQIQLRLMPNRRCALALRCGEVALRSEHLDLLPGACEGLLRVRYLGELFTKIRRGIIRLLHGAVSDPRHGAAAHIVDLGQLRSRPRHLKVRLCLADPQLLLRELRGEIRHVRGRRRNVRLRFAQSRLQVPIIDPGEDLSAPHRLVVIDHHPCDVAGDFRRHGGRMRLNVGIVSRFNESTDGPVSVTGESCCCHDQEASRRPQCVPEPKFAREIGDHESRRARFRGSLADQRRAKRKAQFLAVHLIISDILCPFPVTAGHARSGPG